MTDIEGFLTIYGHSDNLLNNKMDYPTLRGNHLPEALSLLDEERFC